MDTNDRAQFLIFPQDPPRRWGDGKDLLNDALYDELDTLDTASFAEPGRDLEYAGTLGTPGTPGGEEGIRNGPDWLRQVELDKLNGT